MREVGIGISAKTPKLLTTAAVPASDVVVTTGGGTPAWSFRGKHYPDWALDDPTGQGVDAVRPIHPIHPIHDHLDPGVRACPVAYDPQPHMALPA